MKDALFIAYHYPPMVSGASRVKGLVRYLPEFGYRPHVLTATTYGQDVYPQVYRAHELLGLYRALFNRKQHDLTPTQRSFERTDVQGLRQFVRQCKRCFFIPDGQLGWLPHALWVGLRLIRQQRIQLLYSTAPPFSSQLLALGLQRITGLPWVADFRDTWTYDPLDLALAEMPRRLQIEQWLEKKVVHRADRVVGVTDVACEDFGKRYPLIQDRLRCIPNGFDPNDLPDVQARPVNDGVLRLVYTGSFSFSHVSRSPQAFFDAVKRVVDNRVELFSKLKIVIVGALSEAEKKCANALVEAGVVVLVGAVSRQEAIAWQQKADVLLLVDHAREVPASNIPGKCYEYLASQKPILALVPQGATRRLIERLRAGICVCPNDVNAIAQGLEELLDAQNLDTWRVNKDKLVAYEHRSAALQMAACFDEVCQS